MGDEELKILVGYLAELRKDQIQELLRKFDYSVSGNKEQLEARLRRLLAGDDEAAARAIAHLDECAIWGKQHVWLARSVLARREHDQSRCSL